MRSNYSGERGSAILEFALGFAVLWALFCGVFQYGHTMWVYNNLATSVTNGAMFASRAPYDTRNNEFELAVKNVVVYGNPEGTGTSLMAGLRPDHVVVNADPPAGVPRTVTVTVQVFEVNSVFQKFTFTGKPSCTMRFSGKYRTAAP